MNQQKIDQEIHQATKLWNDCLKEKERIFNTSFEQKVNREQFTKEFNRITEKCSQAGANYYELIRKRNNTKISNS
ncbi:MAG: hypothetical protein JEZ06_00280 [Anaerolineaceae bacterium]|nr:hypothetical protein [Anaerolineaceae bacterium]